MKQLKHNLTVLIFTLVYVTIYTNLFAQKPPKGLLNTGTPAPAVITKLWQTPLYINNQPVVGLELKIIPSKGSPFIVQIRKEISLLQTMYYQPGSIVQIRYDPTALPIDPEKFTKKVVIESLGGSADPAGTTSTSNDDPALVASYTAELLKIDSLNKQIRSYGVSSKAVVLTYNSYKNLNIKVNGNNPAITLEIEVLPDDKPSFKATVSGVIMETSIPKFQPGKIIYVKYDPTDLTKVTIDHSQQ
jgi:hypothetical protein